MCGPSLPLGRNPFHLLRVLTGDVVDSRAVQLHVAEPPGLSVFRADGLRAKKNPRRQLPGGRR